MLPYALHGYRTSLRTSMGETPYSLVYGTEAILPVEVEIPSLRVLAEAKVDDVEWIQSQLDHLNLIEEKRLMVICHGQLYQRRIKNTFDKPPIKKKKGEANDPESVRPNRQFHKKSKPKEGLRPRGLGRDPLGKSTDSTMTKRKSIAYVTVVSRARPIRMYTTWPMTRTKPKRTSDHTNVG
ncbi:hypothetical protein CR513_54386, partial [Mucuna pruriens]